MAPAQRQHSRLTQFSKTKLCKFELLGMCTKGTSCPFAHGQEEMKALPDLRRTKLCAAILQSGRCIKENCTFAHSKEELRSTGAFHKTKLCRFETRSGGHCTLGARCNFAHTIDEVRPAETFAEPNKPFATQSPFGSQIWQAKSFKDDHAALEMPPGLSTALQAGPPGLTHGLQAPWPTEVIQEDGAVVSLDPAYVPLPGSVVIDQREDYWKASSAPGSSLVSPLPMKSVRTSESTLCTLGDTYSPGSASSGSSSTNSPGRLDTPSSSLSADAPVFSPSWASFPMKLPLATPPPPPYPIASGEFGL